MCFLHSKKIFFAVFFADKAQNFFKHKKDFLLSFQKFFSDITRTSMLVKNNCHAELVLASLNTHFYSKE